MPAPTIWKYPLDITDLQAIVMPAEADILHVGLDPAGTLCLWVMVNRDVTVTEARQFAVIGTGNPIQYGDLNLNHLGSVVQGPAVWHVFEAE